MKKIEEELALRYLSKEINDTQFEYLISVNGLDKKYMYALVNATRYLFRSVVFAAVMLALTGVLVFINLRLMGM
jgi:hypothetical protein